MHKLQLEIEQWVIKLLRDPLFLEWVTYHDDRERLIRERGRFNPSFTHEDTLPFAADGFAARGRLYENHEPQVTRVSKDRSDFAARTFKGNIK